MSLKLSALDQGSPGRNESKWNIQMKYDSKQNNQTNKRMLYKYMYLCTGTLIGLVIWRAGTGY